MVLLNMPRLYMYEDVQLSASVMLPHNAVILDIEYVGDTLRLYYSVDNPKENRKRCMYTPILRPFPFYISDYELMTFHYIKVHNGDLLMVFRTDNDPDAPDPAPESATQVTRNPRSGFRVNLIRTKGYSLLPNGDPPSKFCRY